MWTWRSCCCYILFVAILFQVIGAFPGNYLTQRATCATCLPDDGQNFDQDSIIYFPIKQKSKVEVKLQQQVKMEVPNATGNILIEERNIFKVRSNCGSGQRMDKAGRCRESFK